MLKVVLGHLRGLPGAPKSAKKVLCSSGIKGKPDDFFSNSVTPIKMENYEDVLYLEQARFYESRAKRADHCKCEPATLINHRSGGFLSLL
jgi:hypothetical protein